MNQIYFFKRTNKKDKSNNKKHLPRFFLLPLANIYQVVAQWLRIHLPIQEMQEKMV